VTPAEFKIAFPEFARALDPLVTSRIAMAEQLTPLSVWGALQVQGVQWMTAHLLTQAPEARDLVKGSRDGSSPYGKHRTFLEGIVSSGFRVANPAAK